MIAPPSMEIFKNLRSLLNWNLKECSAAKLSPSLEALERVGVCMLVTEQEGAEIWSEGKFTGHHTPFLVKVPLNQEKSFEFRRAGHESHVFVLKAQRELTFYYWNLKRIPLSLISWEWCSRPEFLL